METGINKAELLMLDWRLSSTGESFGCGGMVDPKTGGAYTISIEWKDGTELSFGVTYKHYVQLDKLAEHSGECWCRAEDFPDFITSIIN